MRERAWLFAFLHRLRKSQTWTPRWTIPPAPKGDDEHFAEALYEAHARTLGRDAVRQPAWDSLPEWKRKSWRREIRND